MLNRFNNSHALISHLQPWKGYGNGSDGDVTISANQQFPNGIINARHFTLNANVTLTTVRLRPIIIKATKSITIQSGAVIDADGRGYTCQESNNKFSLGGGVSNNTSGSKGVGTGGGNGGNGGWQMDSGGQPVPVNTFLNYITAHYEELLAENNQDIIPLFGGGGGWGANKSGNLSYSVGGGAIILCAPVININNSTLRARGLPGAGANWTGGGGGAGGWIGLFGNELNAQNASYLATGGGGGGANWNGEGDPGNWQNGGRSYGGGYSTGGAGGGSTALNANGGTPGTGGAGTQFTGQPGTTAGVGGYGGNATGSDRGGRGGGGGSAGKISWLQINK